MRDIPTGPALLALARDILLKDLIQLLPQERRLDAMLVANCMAIAEREAATDEGPGRAILQDLELLYAGDAVPLPAPRVGASLSRAAGEAAEGRDAAVRLFRALCTGCPDRRVRSFKTSRS
jgi:hypothetical protein